MADVILFRPAEQYSTRIKSRRAPLGLLNIAACLEREGFRVCVIDCGTTPQWQEKLRENIGPETVAVGVSVMTGHQIHGALEMTTFLRTFTTLPVIWGGLHPSLLPDETIRHPLVNALLVGEGEKRFPEIVRRLQAKESLAGINGVAWKEDGVIRYEPYDHHYLDLNSNPLPAYHLLDVEHYASQYRRFMGSGKRCLDLNTDRGCPGRCGYCYNLDFNRGKRWRAASAGEVLRWTGALVERYNLDSVNFVSDNFFVDPSRVWEICQGLLELPRQIRWHADMRVDSFLRYDDDTLKLMRKSGCTTMTFGIESGSDRILEVIQKGITVADILKAHERLKQFGFLANYHFMIGFPDEIADDLRQTMALLWRIGRTESVVIYTPSLFLPYPGTPLYSLCLEKGFQPPHSLEEWGGYDWELGSRLPWLSQSQKAFLEEVAQTAEGAFFRQRATLASSLKQSYFRIKFWGILRGLPPFTLDRALIRGLKRLFLPTQSQGCQ